MTLLLADCSDEELTSLALAGRQTAYTELMRRHRDWVYRLVRSQIGATDEALDVTQTIFVAAFAALRRFEPTRVFRLWLARIALNKCNDWHRRRKVRKLLAFAAPLEDAENIADAQPDAEASVAGADELSHVMAAIAQLPRSLREPLVLRTIDERSQAATAQILGISEKAVESRVYRARLRLQEKFKGI